MKKVRWIRLMPTLLVLGTLGYSLYSMESGTPEVEEIKTDLQKGLDLVMEDLFAESASAATKLRAKIRDPFWASKAEPPPQEAAVEEPPDAPDSDELAEIVSGMTLEATFLQGRNQIAIIDGRIYQQGQEIAIPEGDETTPRAIQIVAVKHTGVVLRGNGKHYYLHYPDQLGKKEEPGAMAPQGPVPAEIDPTGQLEMFQNLLNSPLGRLGQGLIDGSRGPVGSKLPGKARPRRGARGGTSP